MRAFTDHRHPERLDLLDDGCRNLIRHPLLQLQAARVAERQNEHMEALAERSFEQGEQVKRVTSWAAILFAPTLIAGVYGMNFRHMPELHWLLGYPFAILLMLVFSLGLYLAFKRKHWL